MMKKVLLGCVASAIALVGCSQSNEVVKEDDVIKDANITVNVQSKDPTLQEKTIDASSLYTEKKDIITT